MAHIGLDRAHVNATLAKNVGDSGHLEWVTDLEVGTSAKRTQTEGINSRECQFHEAHRKGFLQDQGLRKNKPLGS